MSILAGLVESLGAEMADTGHHGVHSLLVTGADGALFDWNLVVCMRLMGQERRGQTVSYTCMHEDFEWAKDVAKRMSVTLQEIVRVDGKETYPILVRNCDVIWPNGGTQ